MTHIHHEQIQVDLLYQHVEVVTEVVSQLNLMRKKFFEKQIHLFELDNIDGVVHFFHLNDFLKFEQIDNKESHIHMKTVVMQLHKGEFLYLS